MPGALAALVLYALSAACLCRRGRCARRTGKIAALVSDNALHSPDEQVCPSRQRQRVALARRARLPLSSATTSRCARQTSKIAPLVSDNVALRSPDGQDCHSRQRQRGVALARRARLPLSSATTRRCARQTSKIATLVSDNALRSPDEQDCHSRQRQRRVARGQGCRSCGAPL